MPHKASVKSHVCRRAGCRPVNRCRAQVLRSQGDRRPFCSGGDSLGAVAARRRARKRDACGHREHALHRWSGASCEPGGSNAWTNRRNAWQSLRDRLCGRLTNSIPGLIVNGLKTQRLPNTLSVSLPGVTGQEVLQRVPEICASTGSACHSDGSVSSATLAAMGYGEAAMAGTVRLSVGWYTSEEEVDRASSLLIDAWENLSLVSR